MLKQLVINAESGKTSQQPWSPPPAPAPQLHEYETAIQVHIDQTARERMFRDGVTLASYVADEDEPLWAAQARAFIKWRTAVWKYAYAELAKVQAGERAQPPTVLGFIEELELINWPE